MNEKYVTRLTQDCQLIDFSTELLFLKDIQNLRVTFPIIRKIIDIGCITYLSRSKNKTSNGTLSYSDVSVDLSSFSSERALALPGFIEELSTLLNTGQIREITAYKKVRDAIFFFDWCDSNNFYNVLNDSTEGINAYKAYSYHLIHRVKVNTLSLNTAAVYQNGALFVITSIFNLTDVGVSREVRKIRKSTNAVNKTLPPEGKAVASVLALCNSFFNGASDFIINHRKFPFKITLPKEDVWLLPTKPRFLATKEFLTSREQWAKGQWAWNFEQGTINNHLAITEKYNYPTKELNSYCAKIMISNAEKSLKYNNENSKTFIRHKIASLANKCFIVLFFANTGMNLSQARSLHWSDEYSIKTSSFGFKAVKFRANGKEVEFIIASHFLDTFRKYIKLRAEILSDQDYPFLLFFRESEKKVPSQLPMGALRRVTRDLRRMFYSDIEMITTREWRVNKSNFLIRTTDIATTALLLQNSEETVINSYIEGSEQEYSREFSSYWNRLNEIVRASRRANSETLTSLGTCKEPNNPIAETATSPITPDCRQPEGCLFCNQFAVHADEEDIRKLHSLLYVIKECSTLAKSIEHHNALFGEVNKRLHAILKAINSRSEKLRQLNETIKKDVNQNENLSPYWENKLSMLISIGAL